MLIIFCGAYTQLPQPDAVLTLPDEHKPLVALQFSVTDVIDERDGAGAAGWLVPEAATSASTRLRADLKGGVVGAVRNYIKRNVVMANKQRSIIIGIRQLAIAERILPDQRIEGRIKLQLSCNIRRTSDTIHLSDYSGGMHYTRSRGSRQPIEAALGTCLAGGLRHFISWIDTQAGSNPQLAASVLLSITDYKDAGSEGDTIYYSRTRPLRWQDFQDKSYGSRYTALVFPSFGFDMRQKVTGGVVRVNMAMKVYVPKSACWVKYSYRMPEVLSHEQLHFDIVKVISERFKTALQHTELPPENYEGVIHALYYKFYSHMNEMQEAYDAETQHGRDATVQYIWDKKIKKELQSYQTIANQKQD